MIGLFAIQLLALASGGMAAIADDFSCTDYTSYTATATACANTASDASCQALYKESATGVGYPAAGNSVQRPFLCYTTTGAVGGPIDAGLKKAAINSCAKTCGMCCLTPAYNCTNAQFPSMNCGSILPSQCLSPTWREPIAQNCPSVCGFCNDGGCVDAVTDCANDVSICTNINMQTFVNQYCKKTCARCTASPSNPSNPSNPLPCTTYPADTSASCAAWARNGFCTNDFYKNQWRQYCATTCRIC